MDKTTLYKIFNKAYDHEKWLEVLQSVFGSKLLFSQPKPILLPNSDRINAAFELGSFTTSDDRIIGLYRIDIKPEVWLERNKVTLRGLLRNVYKYDVDGAIVVFTQEKKWRLSFISEIKILNDEGEIVEQATEPKRYTYLLGEGEKVRTSADRLSKLSGKTLSLQDILNAFSVEALNEEFYKIVQEFFYQLLGGEIGKGKKKSDYGEGILRLPSAPKENRQTYQEFAVRLIGRTVFCWFLKMKKSDTGKPLFPENLLSSQAVKENSNYYHSILERLFFQALNTPMEERVENLPDGAEIIPFLNGGLFEPGTDDFYIPNQFTGLNENVLSVDNQWFVEFYEELEKYNFTIDENSIAEVEVSVDPEMLGRIFENLLAEIDPDSGETARKATGSFYTPREIVDYMAVESLVQYLHNKTTIQHERLRPIFKLLEQEYPEFSKSEKENLLDALDKVKILDPACGSGAFPMGILQKIVQALQILDKDATWWKKRQVDRISNAIVKKQLKEKLESSGVEYARKIGVIQNSLYGVDIQPIAAEISKLRCFLSLIVDETIDESKPNRGIEPLPNLEFKFVTADTLIKLPDNNGQRALFDNFEELKELEKLRDEYIQSYGNVKKQLKEDFLKVQQKVAKDQLSLFATPNSKAYKIGNWNPFGHDKSDWFDPKWMFGVETFDVVIGNPPYVSYYSNTGSSLTKEQKVYFVSNYDSVVKENDRINSMNLFIERGFRLLKPNGVLTYIVNKTFAVLPSYLEVRKFIMENGKLQYLISGLDPFKAIVDCVVFGVTNNTQDNYSVKWHNGNLVNFEFVDISQFKKNRNLELHFSKETSVISKIENARNVLEDILIVNRGVNIGGQFDSFLSDTKKDKEYFKFIAGIKSLDKFTYSWNEKSDCYFKFDQELETKLRSEGSTMVLGNPERYLKDKLFIPESAQFLMASYVKERIYSAYGIMVGIPSSVNSNIKYACALINSKLFTFYAIEKEILRKGSKATPHIGVKGLKSIPVHLVPDDVQCVFVNLVDYVILSKNMTCENSLNTTVPNSHIAQLFEEIIDAMVMELYFKEDFEKAGIAFIKYAERDFEGIDGKTEEDAIPIIRAAYQKLRERDNEIRNNLKLMDTRLTDIVMPIKTAK